jgi:hypothetical protein
MLVSNRTVGIVALRHTLAWLRTPKRKGKSNSFEEPSRLCPLLEELSITITAKVMQNARW